MAGKDKLVMVNLNLNTKELENQIKSLLDRTGIFYRLWLRVKSRDSIEEKLARKTDIKDYRMQDLIGCRIVCYFQEDIQICEKIVCTKFEEIEKDRSIDQVDAETFKPERRNYVFKLPQEILELFEDDIWDHTFDKTFECQFRTILSEGWHEIEHDLRYKHLDAWEHSANLSRSLNGIFATLQTSDWALMKICDDLAYKCYKEKDWSGLLRNKVRIKFAGKGLSQRLTDVLDRNSEISKRILNFNKTELLLFLSANRVPITYDNILFCINFITIKNDEILKITPEYILNLQN